MFIGSCCVTILTIIIFIFLIIIIIGANRVRLFTFVYVRVTATFGLSFFGFPSMTEAKEKHPVRRRGVFQGVCFYEYYNDS